MCISKVYTLAERAKFGPTKENVERKIKVGKIKG